jgi:Family of unknown function (DUF6515)
MEGMLMRCLHKANGYFFVWAFLSGLLLFGFTEMGQAAEHWIGRREIREFRDFRYQHNHLYPARGQFVEMLPPGYRLVSFGRARYYFFDGVWYRPSGRRFLIVAPPIGLVVPFLPPYYSTIMVGSVPYYYANEVYYTQTPSGYVVAAPPTGEVSQAPPSQTLPPQGPPPVPPSEGQMSTGQLFIYPRQGQSQKQQATDRSECYNWAVSQIGYDPSKPPAGLPENQMIQRQADFQRAQGACLDGRGYTVR